jgi:ABC-type uncharacterized transport system substrate-binding protein
MTKVTAAFIATSLAGTAVAAFGILLWWYVRNRLLFRQRLPQRLRFTPAHSLLRQRSVAIICDALSPTVKRIYTGLEKSLLDKKTPLYTLDVFEGGGRTNNTRAHVRHCVARGYDALITTSLLTTQIAQEVITGQQATTPIVFCNIPSSEYHIVQHPEAYHYTTGILTERDIETEVAHVLRLRPDTQRALLLSPPISRRWLEYQHEHIIHALERRSVDVATQQVAESFSPLAVDATKYDLIIVPPCALAAEDVSLLAQHCNQHKSTLYTTDFDAVAHGAAIGTGGGEESIGVLVADKIHAIASSPLTPQDIPITTHVTTAQVRLNERYLQHQSIEVPKNLLFVAKQGTVHHSSAR